jgi:iron complex outermembrane recepter protein
VSSAPNGPGFDAAKNESLRGFVDGPFNVTLDGIPFADPDNFQHHTTAYFPATELDRRLKA